MHGLLNQWYSQFTLEREQHDFHILTHLRGANRIQSHIPRLLKSPLQAVQLLQQHLLFSLLTRRKNISPSLAVSYRTAKRLPASLNHYPVPGVIIPKTLYIISRLSQTLNVCVHNPTHRLCTIEHTGGCGDRAGIYTLFNSPFPIVPLL